MLTKTKDTKDKEIIQYYIAPPIVEMLNSAKALVLEKDWDRVYLIDGNEGAGKSLLGLQLGYFFDKTLDISRITFSGQEFSKAIANAKKNQVVIFDEAFNGLSSSGATSKLNRLLVSKLMECRQKNLFIIIILPTIFLLQKYAAIFRSKGLFHVYSLKNGTRGYYKYYNYQSKKLLYLLGKKMYSYQKPYIGKSWRFLGKYPINEEEYRKKKVMTQSFEEDSPKIDRRVVLAAILLKYLREKLGFHYSLAQKLLEANKYKITGRNLYQLVRDYAPADLIIPDKKPKKSKKDG